MLDGEFFKLLAKSFFIMGVFFIAISLFFLLAQSGIDIKLKKLPGDILIKKDNFTLFFPITTSIIISAILTLIFNLLARLFKG